MHKTTESDYHLFSEEILRLSEKWGVSDCNITCRHKKLVDAMAMCETTEGGQVLFTLSTSYDDSCGTCSPSELARHEFFHMLLRQYATLAYRRFVNADQLNDEEERLARMAEKGLA